MSGLRHLVSEMHRRSLWQVLGIYLGGSWVAYQVVLSLVQGLGLPDWVPPVALLLLLLGLPVVLATAFVQERSTGANGGSAGGNASEAHGAVAPEAVSSGAGPAPAGAEPGSTPVQGSAPLLQPASAPRPAPALTWRRAGLAGGTAFLGLGVLVVAFMLLQRAGFGPAGSLAARGELGEVPTLLLAELDPLTGDSALARVVTEAIRVDLSQSTFLSTVDRSRIRHTLDRMGRPAEVRLDGDLAREVAIRMGVAVVAEGDVSRAGSGYNLSLRLVTPDSGRVVASYRETAADSTDILPAVDRLSRRLRSHAGESLRTVRASPPLRDVTTSSLPALQLYVQALDADQRGEGRIRDQLFREALTLDPDFASVKRSFGILFYNNAMPDSALFYLEEALRLEQRMTEVERRATRGQLGVVTGRYPQALVEWTVLTELEPEVPGTWANLGHTLDLMGRFTDAEAAHRRARELGDRRPGPVGWNLVRNLLAQGRVDDARSLLDEIEAEHPEHPTVSGLRDRVLLAEGDLEAVRARWVAMGRPTDELDLARGRPGAVLERARQNRRGQDPRQRMWAAEEQALTELWVLGDPAAAARTLLEGLADPELETLPPGLRLPWGWSAFLLAAADRPAEARRLWNRHEAETPEALRPRDQALGWATEALALGAEGQLDEAVVLLRMARQDRACPACWEPMAARLFEAAGQPDSAAVAWARYTETPWMDAWSYFHPWEGPTHYLLLALAHEQAARRFGELGHEAEAAYHRARFLALWPDPEPGLRPRVEALAR